MVNLRIMVFERIQKKLGGVMMIKRISIIMAILVVVMSLQLIGCSTVQTPNKLVDIQNKPTLHVVIDNGPSKAEDHEYSKFSAMLKDVLSKSFDRIDIIDNYAESKVGDLIIKPQTITINANGKGDDKVTWNHTTNGSTSEKSYYYNFTASTTVDTRIYLYVDEVTVSAVGNGWNTGGGMSLRNPLTMIFDFISFGSLSSSLEKKYKSDAINASLEAAAIDLQNKLVATPQIKDYIEYARSVQGK